MCMRMDRITSIESRLRAALAPVHLDVIDDSHKHAGHAGSSGGTHVTVIVVSDAFAGKSAVDRQRMVYAVFTDEMRTGEIHAMALTTRTPAEWERASAAR